MKVWRMDVLVYDPYTLLIRETHLVMTLEGSEEESFVSVEAKGKGLSSLEKQPRNIR